MNFSKPRKIKQNRPKPWLVVISHQQKRVSKYFSSESNALVMVRKWQNSLTLGRFILDYSKIAQTLGLSEERKTTDNVRWMSVLEAYLVTLPDINLRAATIKDYEGSIERCGRWLNNPPMNQVKKKDLVNYIEAKGKTKTSRKSLRGTLTAFGNWAADKGYCKREIFDRLKLREIKEDRERASYLTVEEVQRLFEFLVVQNPGSAKQLTVNVKKSLQLRAGVGCAIFLGIRPGDEMTGFARYGELPLLKRKDFNLQDRLLVVPSRISKTRVERRIYDVPANLLEAIGTAGYREHDYILPGGYGWLRQCLGKARKRIVDAGYPEINWGQKIMRHTFGTNAVHRGNHRWAIEAGGWQDTTVMEKHYVNNVEPEDAAEFWAMQIAGLPKRWLDAATRKKLKEVMRGFVLRDQAERRLPLTEYLSEGSIKYMDEVVQATGLSRSRIIEQAITSLQKERGD